MIIFSFVVSKGIRRLVELNGSHHPPKRGGTPLTQPEALKLRNPAWLKTVLWRLRTTRCYCCCRTRTRQLVASIKVWSLLINVIVGMRRPIRRTRKNVIAIVIPGGQAATALCSLNARDNT